MRERTFIMVLSCYAHLVTLRRLKMSPEKKDWKDMVSPSFVNAASPSSEPIEWAEAVSIIDSCVHDVIANSPDDDEQGRLMIAWSRMLRG